MLSEHFQSSDSKQKYDETTDEFLCSNLLLRCSGQAALQDIMVTAGEGVYCQKGYKRKSWDVRECQGKSGDVRDVRRWQVMSRDGRG